MNLFPASYFFKSTIVFSLLICSHAQGQVVPDETLPENSAVTSQDSTIQIDGGTQAGDNLFHSFERFSVPVDNTASFNNAVEIQNIFSRVTGSSISEIDGIVRANGTANLFLINPNGIIFGENASLNIGGSFLGSTADSIIFSDGFEFSATNSQTTPLLTISAPIGLGIKATSGDIINRSFATDIDGNFVGLQVPGEQTLAFVGGNVFIEGGILTAESGRIEIGSVGEDNTVNLSLTEQGFSLDYQEVREFKDINLSALAFVDTSGDKGGDISIQGRQLILTGDSAVVSTTFGTEAGGTVEINTSELVEMDGDATTISTSTEGTGKAGDIFIETNRLIVRDGAFVENVSLAEGSAGNLTVKATESVDLVGTTSDIEFPSGLFAEANDVGSGGNLTVETQNLTVRDGAAISISNFGIGQGGNLTIKATESFEVLGTALDDAFPTTVRADADSIGSGGTLIVETQRLTIKDGAKISTDTFFNGDAGNLIIKASESIELFGTSEDGLDASGLFALVNDSASGNGGTISIETKQLIVRDGAQISTLASNEGQGGTATINASDSILLSGTSSLDDAFSSSGVFVSASLGSSGDAGELTINTGELTVEKGAKISADNFGMRAGANVDLNVDRLIIRDGGIVGAGTLLQPVGSTEEDITDNIRGSGGTLTVNATESVAITGTGNIGETPVNSTLFTRAEGTGNAGNLTINTPNLTVANGGDINVSATGAGDAGSLEVDAGNIQLNDGAITAQTRSTQGGNIILNIDDNLELRNDSEITATAGTAQAGGDGGNVILNSDFILAFPTTNQHEITAEAFTGNGGSINISTNNLLGRDNLNISASSDSGIDGTISVETPDVDPTSGIIELPTVPIDAEAIFAQDLCKFENDQIAKGSSFIITGRGGLTPTSEESLDNLDNVVGWANRDDIEVSENGVVGVRQRSTTETETTNYPVVRQSQGWVTTADGSVWLVANSPETIPQNAKIVHPDCGNSSQ